MVHSNFVDVFLMIFQLLDEFRGFWIDLIQNQHCFDAFSQCVCVFYCANLMIFSGNLRFRAIFVGSSTGFFAKYAVFGALLMYLFDFSVFFTFWSSFGALLMVLWNFVDVFLVIFQLLNEFRWFWIDLIQNLT